MEALFFSCSNLLFFLLMKTMNSSYAQRENTNSCKLLVTDMKTQSMNTFVYWKSNFSRHSRFNVEYRYDVHNPWTRVSCSRPPYDRNASEEMSCLFLTCATTAVNPFYGEIYEIRLNAYENETTKCNSSTYLYEPALNNIPARITDVNISRISSLSANISWERPLNSCNKSKYCLELIYRKEDGKINKTKTISSTSMTSRSTIVKGLEVDTNYTLFLVAYQEYMCSRQPFLLWTSEPFYLPSVRMIIYDSSAIDFSNFVATISWRTATLSWQVSPSEYSVHYKYGDVANSNWSRSDSVIQQDISRNIFTCKFLNCSTVELRPYLVQIRFQGKGNRSDNVLHFNPHLKNAVDRVHDVTVTAMSSSSMRVAWRLPPPSCSKFKYCLTFLYHERDSSNKTIDVKDVEMSNEFIVVRDLLSYKRYWFYAVTYTVRYSPNMGCLHHSNYSRHATGPFVNVTFEDDDLNSEAKRSSDALLISLAVTLPLLFIIVFGLFLLYKWNTSRKRSSPPAEVLWSRLHLFSNAFYVKVNIQRSKSFLMIS
ncbi:uncharacterized protein LOC124452814 isoform X2 [Xenia sp. Carnegie-2017]|uniref:uncharacterized protein LOC124452814 isoform X2 n=1 Tax=Xenia sp. Carnegie-2017 TaxID=2897299 RepID=UPI001F038BA5|nr:uncharacterized protein LOC124452814 isoform X2 [Xenia sp. Carnegie-2017]